jgi:hypothetical protein
MASIIPPFADRRLLGLKGTMSEADCMCGALDSMAQLSAQDRQRARHATAGTRVARDLDGRTKATVELAFDAFVESYTPKDERPPTA